MIRKGSFELSVSFLVILIVAIAVLSLLLYFVVHGMRSSQEQLNQAYAPGAAIVTYYASSEQPILFQGNEYNVKPGSGSNAFVSIYNGDFAPNKEITIAILDCVNTDDNQENGISISAVPQYIETGKAAGYKIIISAADNVLKGKYICTVAAGYADGAGIDIQQKFNTAQLSVNVI
jgi:hypothetical protein